uniref:signal peptide peptidase-like 2B isoform X2 n=1 Tax=Myxine glutinosa TaxID=7769 RepID=UPI00358FC93B
MGSVRPRLLCVQMMCVYTLVALSALPFLANAEFAVLNVQGNDSNQNYCVMYNHMLSHLASHLHTTRMYQLQNLSWLELCGPEDIPTKGFPDTMLLVKRGKCTFARKVELAARGGAHGLLVVSDDPLVTPSGSGFMPDNMSIPLALIRRQDVINISHLGKRSLWAALVAMPKSIFNWSILIIFALAVGTVVLGGYWAGLCDDEMKRMKYKQEDGEEKLDTKVKAETLDISPTIAVIFVLMMSTMIVLLYFFYDYFVYVVIVLFCLASAMGLYKCLLPLVERLPLKTYEFSRTSLPCVHKLPQPQLIVLAAACLSLSATWFVFRHDDRWAWALQDLLGMAFCLNMMRMVRIPNFKGCLILLSFLFFYDVFFVFITPFLTKSGESVMMEVATGPSNSTAKEMIPLLFKIPALQPSLTSLCQGITFSLLGFGDVVLPGMVVVYCHRFDIRIQAPKIYFIFSVLSYAVGLILTFVALMLMQMGQPALLYIVPCMLLTTTIVACVRREMPMFWRNTKPMGEVSRCLPSTGGVCRPPGVFAVHRGCLPSTGGVCRPPGVFAVHRGCLPSTGGVCCWRTHLPTVETLDIVTISQEPSDANLIEDEKRPVIHGQDDASIYGTKNTLQQ